MGSAFLNHACNLESAPAEDFFEGTDSARRLLENQVEGPWGGASRDDDGLLSFQEGYRVPFFAVVHGEPTTRPSHSCTMRRIRFASSSGITQS